MFSRKILGVSAFGFWIDGGWWIGNWGGGQVQTEDGRLLGKMASQTSHEAIAVTAKSTGKHEMDSNKAMSRL